MKAYLIDPYAKMIVEVDYDDKRQRHLNRLIGAETLDYARINDAGDGVFVDDSGLLHDIETQSFFTIVGYGNPLAGRGLFVGANEDGESVAPSISIGKLTQMVSFWTYAEIRQRLVTTPTVMSFASVEDMMRHIGGTDTP